MNICELTQALVNIESTTGNECRVGEFLIAHLSPMAAQFGGQVERQEVEAERFNVLATWGEPVVTLSTHMDTVPPYFPAGEDGDLIRGRGSCDAKGIIAAMIEGARRLLEAGTRGIALLFVVGEEKNSAGAKVAARNPRGSRFIICGEPTENKLALGSKGSLRYEIVASGKMGHSAYPELGESAVDKLLDALQRVRAIPMPSDDLLGPSTINIGTIEGGRAPNVIADHAKAEILIRLVQDPTPLQEAVGAACAGSADAREILCIPAVRLGNLDRLPTTVAAFTTDIPAFGTAWGTPYLIGPGSIHVAHTMEEHIAKRDLNSAVEIYVSIANRLMAGG